MRFFAITLTLLFSNYLVCFCQTQVVNSPQSIEFISDTQSPLFLERIIRKTNHNEKATKLIFENINAKRPSSIFILGDVVSLGFSKKKWKKMDGYLTTSRKNNISVYATLGNHDVMLHAKKGARLFKSRFPTYSPTGFVTIVDSVAIVLLNSNFNKMTASQIKFQDDWYIKTLQQLNKDSAIQLIVVGCHHSPFTNSKVVAPNKLVQQKFIPAFLVSKKSILFLSGHSHNFERFNVQGKTFLVVGGGGGVHQPLKKQNTLFKDITTDYKPMFHYLNVERRQNALQVTSIQLKNDFSGFEDGLKLILKAN